MSTTQVLTSNYRSAVKSAIDAALKRGLTDFDDILASTDGADPSLVKSILAGIGGFPSGGASAVRRTPDRDVLDVLPEYPAPDPARSQWWFSSQGLKRLLDLVLQSSVPIDKPMVLSLGSPTLGAVLCQRKLETTIFDIDPDVIASIEKALKDFPCTSEAHDARHPLPDRLKGKFHVVVVDPPWYQPTLYAFLNCAFDALVPGGEVFCTLPGRLTRPDVETLTQQLFVDLMASHHEILRFERGTIEYQVPQFEFAAIRRQIAEFVGLPWRSGDLVQIRKGSGPPLVAAAEVIEPQVRFSRNSSEFRVFARNKGSAKDAIVLPLKRYSSSISTRAHADEVPDVWSSEKVGIQTSNIEIVHVTLKAWADGLDQEKTIETLIAAGRSRIDASHIVSELDEAFGLWRSFASQPSLRTEEELAKIRSAALTHWASPTTEREHPERPDPYRTTFQRDRDRVLWSAGLRRLSNKTQLFPTLHDDDLRQRLTHSIEVYQLAATIGTSFGLDGDLIEAGSLAHDIGHTPFGHAGEHALDRLFHQIDKNLGGFNHYEHGVDVVRFLEGPYYASSNSQFSGLNLSDEVLECIFKHTYCHTGDLGSEDLRKLSKHKARIKSGYCHLEGQAVRAADKISYLISDIEDGIRLNCITHEDLLSCRLFHRPPLNLNPNPHQTLHEQFLEQRRILLKILMEDILKATSKRLAQLSPVALFSVRNASVYSIQHSDDILGDMSEIWTKLQAGKLHKDGRVVSANLQAARIVAELTTVYSVIPDLMDDRFSLEYERLKSSEYLDFYRQKVGIGNGVEFRPELVSFLPIHLLLGSKNELGKEVEVPIEDLIMAKDYVAGLSDSRARQLHSEIFKS